MNAPSNANTSGLEVVAWRSTWTGHTGKTCHAYHQDKQESDGNAEHMSGVSEPLVTAASAQARIAELEAELDQIAGESIWWKAVIGDGEYTPAGEVPSIKHLHPATVKPIFEAHKGSAVADVIAGLIFSRAITENREQFLVAYHTDRATAAEARNAEVSMLAYRWMEAHDRLKAGLDYDLPTPADLPNEKARADRLAKALERAKRVLDNTAITNALRMVGAYEILDAALQQETQP